MIDGVYRTMRPFTLLLLSAACCSSLLAQAPQALSSESPFLPGPGPATSKQATTENAAFELRGIMVNGNATLFNIVNTATKKSRWVGLRETGSDFVVKSHEQVDGNDSITIEHQGRTMTIALAKPKVQSSGRPTMPEGPRPAQIMPQPAGMIPGMPPQQQQAQGPVSPVVINPTPADEARRLEAVAAEVRRRRALRQQASEPGAQQNPQ